MKSFLPVPLLGLALAAWSASAQAKEVVVLPGVVGPVGVTNGVTTQGPGTLTVGEQNINTSNEAGGGITTTAANTANIAFNGSSTVTGDVGASGSTFLNIAAGANGKTVTFNGQVFSTTFTLTGTGTANFNRGFVSNTGSTMDFAGDGFITVGAGQTVKAAITNTAGANTGTLTLNPNSILDGAVGAASGLKAINLNGGNALITGEAKAGTFNLGTSTLNIAGALSIPVGGVINTTIFSTGLYGKILPVGASTIGTGLHVNVIVTGPIVNGSSFNIVDATSGSSGGTVTVVSNTTRYAFSAAPVTNGLVRITTTQIPLAVIVLPVIPGAPPVVTPTTPIVVGPIIDALPVTPVTSPLLTAITLLPTPQAVAAALAQLGPGTANLAAPQTSIRVSQRFQDLVTAHLGSLQTCAQAGQADERRRVRQEDASDCQPDDLRSHWWLTGFGEFNRQEDVGGFEGHNARILGAMLAYDRSLGDAAHAGLGVGYARSNVDGNVGASHADITSWQVTGYLGYAPGPWYLNGAVTYGTDKYAGSRHVLFPGVDSRVMAEYSGKQLSALATTGYRFYVGDGRTVVTPYATLQYANLKTDAYSEFGDPSLNLNIASQSYNFGQTGLGLRISRDPAVASPTFFRPEIHAEWRHAITSDAMSESSSFASGGASFTTVGLTPSRDTYNFGGGFVFGHSNRWSVEGAYDNVWRAQGYSAQRLMFTFSMHL